MRIVRPEINVRPISGFGKANGLLQLIHANAIPNVTFLLTTRCDLKCAHCYSPRPDKPVDLNFDLVKDTIDELKGDNLHVFFSGGEPFMYGGQQEQRFLDLICYTAERVSGVYLDTNGLFLMKNQRAGNSFLNQLPYRTTIIMSVDRYHMDAFDQAGQSLTDTYHRLCTSYEGNVNVETNVRLNASERHRSRKEIVRSLGMDTTFMGSYGPWLNIEVSGHVNSLYAHGAARGLPKSETLPVSLQDFVNHAHKVQSIGLFINPWGYATSGDHAAYMEHPPAFATLGNIHEHTLAHILWNNLLPGYLYDGWRPSRAEMLTFFDWPFLHGVRKNRAEMQLATELLYKKTKHRVTAKELAAMLQDPTLPMDVKIDVETKLEKEILKFMGKEVLHNAIQKGAISFAKTLQAGELNWNQPNRRLVMGLNFLVRDNILNMELTPSPRQPDWSYENVPSKNFLVFINAVFDLVGKEIGKKPAKAHFICTFRSIVRDTFSSADGPSDVKIRQLCLDECDKRLS